MPKGGKRAGAGRKSIKSGEKSLYYSLRLSESQRDRLDALGGAVWIRQQIDPEHGSVAADLIARLRGLSRHEHSDFSVGDEAADALDTLLKAADTLKMQGEPEVAEGWVAVTEEVWNQVIERIFGPDWWVRK